jgi:ribosome-associated protein
VTSPTPEQTSDDSLVVNDRLAIPRHELMARASRAGGAGGQHVNTSSTRIELLWNVRTSAVLDEETRARLLAKLSTKLDGEGTLRVVASDRRSQRQNRESAEQRLTEMVRRALIVPKKRRATRPSRASKEKRISEKKKRGETKASRRKDGFD